MAAPTEWKTIPAYAAHLATLLPQRPPATRLTKELRSLRSPFTKTRVCLPLHCAACWSNLGATCPVVLNLLPALNEWFMSLAVEVHEIKPGRLALSAIENDTKARGVTWEGNHAAILLHCLLTRHRCLEVLDGLHAVLSCYTRVFCDALRKGALNILRLNKCELTSGAARSLMASIRGSECITELSLNSCKFYSGSVQAVEHAVVDIISKSKSLRLLDAADSELFQDSAALIESLEKNGSIENLAVGTSVLTGEQGTTFCRYLSNNKTLRTLTIVAGYIGKSPELDSVFDALVENSTLNGLVLKYFCLDLAAALIFVRLIARNKTLSEVDFSCCSWDFQSVRETQGGDGGTQAPVYSYAANLVGKISPAQPLILALKKTSSLRRLSVKQIFTDSCSHVLLAEAASCSSLEQLTFDPVYHASSFYHALRDTHASDKVRLGTCYAKVEDFVLALESCGELLGMGKHQFISLDKLGFHKVVSALPLHDHITGLDLHLGYEWDGVAEEDASLIAGYLSSTRVLKNMCMRFNVSKELAHVIVEGLCKNETIEKLSIEDWLMQDDDVRTLCGWVAASRKVYHLSYLCAEVQACWTLVRSLARLLPSCYTLTYVRVVEYPSNAHIWQTVKQLRRRNLSLVECAVSFVLGSTLKRAAAAFERMSWHPQVVSKAQHELRVGPAELNARFAECRRRLQMDFWQIAGVVRGELVCHERVDGQMQIDQLGMDAWLYVRAFLSIDDVLDGPAKKSRKRKRR
uniref:Putative nlr family card domain protein n=1 Tax=Amblyomma aureolatum TaxID=187763 RepID=A0A1E1XEG2_9ACAR